MRISMPRGDIYYIDIVLSDNENEEIDYDEIYFTVKRKYTEQPYLFQKRLTTGGITKIDTNRYRIKIDRADTQDLAICKPNEYYDFDINIVYQDLIDSTFCGEFILTKEVTWASNKG